MAQADQKLTAVLSATENISDALNEITEALSKTAAGAEGAESAVEDVEQATAKLAASIAASNPQIQDESEALMTLSQAAKKAKEAKNAVSIANSKLAAAARKTGSEINEETRSMMSLAAGANSVDDFLADLAATGFITAQQMDELADELDDVAISSLTASSSAAAFAPILRAVSESADEAEDEVRSLSDAVDGAGASFLKASLNLGPFSFALKNIFVTMPQLITVVGALSSALIGLSVAAVAAGVALGTVFTGGLLAIAEGMASSSSDIENQMQAVQKIMEKIGKAFSRALAPLKNPQSISMFIRAVNGLLVIVNRVAKSMASVQDALSDMQGAMGQAFIGNLDEITAAVENMFTRIGPMVTAFVEWFSNRLPGALGWFTKITEEFGPTLASLTGTMIHFFRSFSELGAAILQGVLPVIQGTLKAIQWIADALNLLPNAVTASFFAFATLIYIVVKTKNAFETLSEKFENLTDWLKDDGMVLAKRKVDTLRGGIEKLNQTFADVDTAKGVVETSMDAIQKEFIEGSRAAALYADTLDDLQVEMKEVSTGNHMIAEGQVPSGKLDQLAKTKDAVQELKSEGKLEMQPGVEGSFSGFGKKTTENMQELIHGQEKLTQKTENTGVEMVNTGTSALYLLKKLKNLGVFGQIAARAITALASALTTLVSVLGSVATGGILVAALIAIAAVAQWVSEKMGFMAKIMNAVNETFAFLGHLIGAIVNPVFNALIDILEFVMSPIVAILDGFVLLIEATGIIGAIISSAKALGSVLMDIAAAWSAFWGGIGAVFDFLADAMYNTIIFFFEVIARVIRGVIASVKDLIGWFDDMGTKVANMVIYNTKWFQVLSDAWDNAMSWMGSQWGGFVDWVESGVNRLIRNLNAFITLFNKMPGNDMEKIDTFSFSDDSKSKASTFLEEHKKESGKKNIAKGRKIVNNNTTKNEYNFGNFNMLPKEKARVKGLVKQALRDANRNKRLEGGHIG